MSKMRLLNENQIHHCRQIDFWMDLYYHLSYHVCGRID